MTAQPSTYTKELHRGLVHHKHGELDLARRAYRKVLRLRPADADALRLIATLEMQRGRHAQAEQFAHRALRAAPDQASVHNTMGQVLSSQGRYAEAAQSFESALTLDESLAVAGAGLGRCLLRTGKVDDGLAQMCAAAEREPGDAALACEIAVALQQCGNDAAAEQYFLLAYQWAPEAAVSYLNLGAFYIDQNKADQAVPWLSKAVEMNLNDPAAWMNLGRALRMLGEYDAAIECLQNVLSLQPNDPDTLACVASILHQKGEYDEARRLFGQVLDLHPQNAMAVQGMAELQEWSGDYQAAVDGLRPLIAAGSFSPHMAVTFARALRRVDGREEAVALLERLLGDGAPVISRPLLRQLHFTLAGLQDDLGRYESAWQHFTAANSMQPLCFDSESHAAMIEQLIAEAVGTAVVNSESPISDERPVFIVGMPRSGTSLVEQILASHPQVHVLGETGVVGAACQPDAASPESAEAVGHDRIAAAFAQLIETAPRSATRIVEKSPLNFLFLDRIQSAFPGARIVHCMRHPLDTMLSCYFTDFASPGLSFTCDLESLERYYRDYQRLMQHWRDRLTLPMLEVQYEELVLDPETQIRGLLDFLGLDWDERCSQPHLSGRTTHTASHAQVREPIYTRAVGRWQNYARFLGGLQERFGA